MVILKLNVFKLHQCNQLITNYTTQLNDRNYRYQIQSHVTFIIYDEIINLTGKLAYATALYVMLYIT